MCPSSKVAGGFGGESSVYLLNCSVCKEQFNGKIKWEQHLTLGDHQILARESLQKDINNLRECSLVIFTTYDITIEGAEKIIKYFGRDQSIWVTDFLWWEDRPRFAVVQFESREKLNQVLLEVESFSGELIQIYDNQGIQLKGAFDLLDLEWKAILPGSNPAPLSVPPKSFQKSAQESEASIATQNDKHHRLSNSNTTAADTTENADFENLEAGNDFSNYVKLLFDLAEKRCWEPPDFKVEQLKNPRQKTKYICSVLLNGQVYKPHWFTGRAKNHAQAKQIAGKFCIQSLKSSEDHNIFENVDCTNSSEEITDDNDEQDGPVGIVRALSQELYGKSPENKVEKYGEMYLCRVIVNGFTYKPTRQPDMGETPALAKLKTANFFIKKIEKEFGISAQEYLSFPPSQLSHQFREISQFVEIPDLKYKEIVQVVLSFRSVLRKCVPFTQVVIFRNWYLKLRNSAPAGNTDAEDDPLFLYVYSDSEVPDSGVPPSEDNFNWIPGKLVHKAIRQFNELFDRSETTFPDPGDHNESRLGCKFLHKPSGISFVVVNFKRTMVEAQCCRLVKYFCEFDPRIRPLLCLARYWSITNEIHWGEPQVGAKTAHQCLPEPYPLDWMILTFLMAEKCAKFKNHFGKTS